MAPRIIREFSHILDTADGTLPMEITAASRDFKAADIAKDFEKALGKKVRVTVKHEPSIRGGIRIKIGDTLIDNTLSRRMQILREALKS